MSPMPLLVATLAIVIPALLHRWELGRMPPGSRRSGWARGASSVILALILAFVAALFALSVARGHLASLGPLVVLLVILFPWHLTRYLLIPLARPRLAYHFAQLSGWIWRGDVPGGQLVAGAWALLRRRGPDRAALAWLEARRDALPALGATGVLGAALLEDARGRTEVARQMVESIFDFDEHDRPPLTLALAVHWLIVERAARGDWARVELLGRTHARGDRGGRFLGTVAARLVGRAPVPGRAQLVIAWLLAPARVASLALLRRALAAAPVDPGTPQRPRESRGAAPTVAGHDNAVEDTMGLHTGTVLTARSGLDLDELARLGRAWDHTLDGDALRSRAARRAIALSGGDPDRVVRRFADEVGQDLHALIADARIPLGALEAVDSGCLNRVARGLRHQLLDELAVSAEALRDRVAAHRALPAIDEIREWMELRGAYERVAEIGGRELQRVAFSQIHDPLCNLAVWLWESRHESSTANAMFRWLLEEALLAGDDEMIALERRNVACGT